MKLFIVHCGFYDLELCGGIYEGHVNLFVAAKDFEDAKNKVRLEEEFKKKKMHVDGLQEIGTVNGYLVQMIPDESRGTQTRLTSSLYRDF